MPTKKSLIQRLDDISVPLPVLVRALLGAYFIRAGIVKAMDPVDFLQMVRTYHLLPESPPIFLNSTAVVLPWLEIACGLALVLGLFMRGAGTLIAAMLCVFTPAIFLRALAVMAEEGIPFFQVEFDCGCGVGSETIWIKLLTNTGLFLLAVLSILFRSRRFTLTMALDRFRSQASYCRRCGYPASNLADGVCVSCRDVAPASVGASGATP